MKILAVTQTFPHPEHSSRAANVVLFEILRALLEIDAVDYLSLMMVFPEGSQSPDLREQRAIDDLRVLGLQGVDVVTYGSARGNRRPRKYSPEYFYPVLSARSEAERVVRAHEPDVVLLMWAEQSVALLADLGRCRFAYYGNPDMNPIRAGVRFRRRHGGSLREYVQGTVKAKMLERAHLRFIKKWTFIGELSAHDARYYARKGHKNSFYLQNCWIDRGLPRKADLLRRDKSPAVIVANVGKLFATANSFGLEYLHKQLLPKLRERFGRRLFELHIFGIGDPWPQNATLFDQPEIIKRGFVEDIDAELQAADLFLCVNNATEYNVGHTRYLHAWSLGCCVVASAEVRKVMPEFIHEYNALLGKDASEIADLVVRAIDDPILRENTGKQGYETFKKYFTPSIVARKIVEKVADL